MIQNKRLSDANPATIVGWVFTVVAFVLLVISLVLLWMDRQATATNVRVEGKVLTLNYNGNAAAPVIEYRLNGTRHRFQGTVWTAPPAYAVDEKVVVILPEGKPSGAFIDSWMDRYFVIFFLAGFAIVFGGIGLALLYFFRQ